MPRYYFDTSDRDTFIKDEWGLELKGIEEARDHATEGLADLAREAIPGSLRRELAVEVREEADKRVIRASLWFEVAVLEG